MACFSYLRKPRQVSSLVSSYLKTTSIIKDPITKPPLLSVKAASFSSSSEKHSPSSSIQTSSPPWLMLTPEINLKSGTDTVFKFYSLAEDKVISIDRKNLKDQLGLESKGGVDLECKGSSHGWLALFDNYSSDLFLYNPLSNSHLKLPTIRELEAIPEEDRECGFRCVNKLIISSSDPEGDANCRALMIHGFNDHLAFCCPNSSDDWVETHHRYNDVVCGDSDGTLFFGVDDSVRPYYPEFEGWDLRDISRPMLISLEDRLDKDFAGQTFPWKGYSSFKKPWTRCRVVNFLVPAAADDDKDAAMYYVCVNGGNLNYVNENGDYTNEGGDYRFHVHKLDFVSGKVVYMDRSLDGLAFFVGRNHSFALSANEFPEVEADSIYFTHPEDGYAEKRPFGRKHLQAYDYEDGNFWSPSYTLNTERSLLFSESPPMWYTPTCADAALL